MPAYLELVPTSLADARAFIAAHHSHNSPPRGWKFGTSVVRADGQLVGVGVAGRPVAKALQHDRSIEITRVCTLGERNACSMIYGALARAAAALGFVDCYTYTLESECAACVRAAGFTVDARCSDTRGWDRPKRARDGEVTARSDGPKIRWYRHLGKVA